MEGEQASGEEKALSDEPLLTPEEASKHLGVPAAQLKRWALNKKGPRNRGTYLNPRYERDELDAWKSATPLRTWSERIR